LFKGQTFDWKSSRPDFINLIALSLG
jgi:hypothetical protein